MKAMKEDAAFRCCWTCVHCTLDICRGYECDAVPPSLSPIHLADRGERHLLYKDRSKCRAYKRG